MQEIEFYFKSRLLMLRRGIINLLRPIKRHKVVNTTQNRSKTLFQVNTTLFTHIDPAQNHLRLGKIENLKICAQMLDSLYIPSGEVFSFWRQIGKTTRAKGFVYGREMRHGKLIPTIGGGICQLSSSIYQAAKNSSLEIIERHEHSKIVEGAAFPKGEDANVFWNYVDLRFRTTRDIILSVAVTDIELIVQIIAAENLQNKTNI